MFALSFINHNLCSFLLPLEWAMCNQGKRSYRNDGLWDRERVTANTFKHCPIMPNVMPRRGRCSLFLFWTKVFLKSSIEMSREISSEIICFKDSIHSCVVWENVHSWEIAFKKLPLRRASKWEGVVLGSIADFRIGSVIKGVSRDWRELRRFLWRKACSIAILSWREVVWLALFYHLFFSGVELKS